MSRIFISYRREDHPHAAARVAAELQRLLPDFEVFIDVDGIRPGEDFGAKLDRELEDCAYLLVIVGKKWIGRPRSRTKPPKIADSGDWVRREIVTSLNRKIPVVPILIDGAKLPPVHDLPDDLKPLHNKQFYRVTHVEFGSQMAGLVAKLFKNENSQMELAGRAERAGLPERYMAWFDHSKFRPEVEPGVLPLAPKPIRLDDLPQDEAVALLVEWFFENFQDPVNSTPYDGREGGYQYIHGGPYDAREELEDQFRDVSEGIINAAVEEIESDGQTDWAPSHRRIVDREL